MLQRRLRQTPLRDFPQVFSQILVCRALTDTLRERPQMRCGGAGQQSCLAFCVWSFGYTGGKSRTRSGEKVGPRLFNRLNALALGPALGGRLWPESATGRQCCALQRGWPA